MSSKLNTRSEQRLAIEGGAPLRQQPFPDWPQWNEREARALQEVLDSGQWWAPAGTQVKQFEREFAAYQDASYAVAITNGSAAIEVALRAAGLDWGDEVITTAYSFIATANSCLLVGAIPRFVDILPESWNMDPSQIEAATTPRTKAILPVHMAGEPADMDAILKIAGRHNLLVIEDAAQAHGAIWAGRKVGAIGQMGCFSFQASKNITGGEGGIILSNDEEWAERCWSVHNVGRDRHGAWYQHITLASNYRLSEWAGAVLRVQLSRLDEQAERRMQNGAYLSQALAAQANGLTPLPGDSRVTRNAYHLLKLRYEPAAFGGHSAAEFAQAIAAEGIPISPGYPEPLYQTDVISRRTAFIEERLGIPHVEQPECPVTIEACRNGLWLRQAALLGTTADMDDIVTATLKIQRAWG